MTNTTRRRPFGYTITEMMIATAIVATISSIGAVLSIRLQNFYLSTTARNDIQRDARAALDVINRELRQAKYSTIQIDSPTGQGYYSRIQFNLIDGRYMSFYQNGNQLVAKSTTTTAVLTKNLYYLAFSFPDSQNPTIVNVSMTMFKNIQLGRKSVLQMSIQKVRVMN